MPTAPTTPTQQKTPPVSRRRVVDVIGRVEAQAFTTLTSGDKVAIECHTAHGTVVVRGPLAAFIASCRSERDANGQPFRRPCSSLAILEADAAATARAAQARPPVLKPGGAIL